jgi:hypothetical protein
VLRWPVHIKPTAGRVHSATFELPFIESVVGRERFIQASVPMFCIEAHGVCLFRMARNESVGVDVVASITVRSLIGIEHGEDATKKSRFVFCGALRDRCSRRIGAI